MEGQYKYFAFISYNSKDTEWGKRVQRKLEHYRMPATLCSERGWKRTPIKPVFFAPTDIQPGGLTEELQERLKASRNLIVICSPNSAQSEWVGKEIEYFHSLGRTKQIHFFIVDGIPHSGNPETECFNPIVETLGLQEILGANIHEKIYRWSWMNKERAYVQLISKLLGVEFDTIWQRHKRLFVQKVMVCTLGIAAVVATIFGVWLNNQPVDVKVMLNEASIHNGQLPPLKDAVITLILDNEEKTDTIHSMGGDIIYTNIPQRYLNNEIRMTAVCRDFEDVDTLLTLSKEVTINLRRDPSVYGEVRFQLWDPNTEQCIPKVTIQVGDREVTSDINGYVSLFIPLPHQQQFYHITSSFPLLNDTIYMPCGENDLILKE